MGERTLTGADRVALRAERRQQIARLSRPTRSREQALMRMVIRYGSSERESVHAQRDGDWPRDAYHSRAAKRQFAALQRLVYGG